MREDPPLRPELETLDNLAPEDDPPPPEAPTEEDKREDPVEGLMSLSQ